MLERSLNFVGFQVIWFACVLGAAWQRPWLGPLVALPLFLAHLGTRQRRSAEIRLLAGSGSLGFALDSLLVFGGLVAFPESARLGGPSTLWMVTLWVAFACTLRGPLSWLLERPMLAALLGLLAGPLSYFAGARLGAIELGAPLWLSLAAVGATWGLAMLVLLRLAGEPSPTPSPEATGARLRPEEAP